jgi:hypothetical protein
MKHDGQIVQIFKIPQSIAILLALIWLVLETAYGQGSGVSRRAEILPGVWWKPLQTMQIRRRPVDKALSSSAENHDLIAVGAQVHLQEIKSGKAKISIENDTGEYWTDLDNLEPVGSCLSDGREQYEFIAMNSALTIFLNPNRDASANPLPTAAEISPEQQFTHTYNSLLAGIKRYGEDTAVLLYYYGASAACTLLFSRHGIAGYSISSVPRDVFEHLIDRYVYFAKKGLEALSPSKELSRILISPDIEKALRGYNNLIVVPYGVISLVPFGALNLESERTELLTKHTITIAPGLTQVGIGRGLHARDQLTPETPTAVVVGNPEYHDKEFKFPNLEYAQKEAEVVAKALAVQPLEGDHAKLRDLASMMANVQRRDQQLGILYLASHGVADTRPTFFSKSFVALADGDRLDESTLASIGYRGSRLVVLSACETGIGWIDDVGSVSLTRLFHLRGAHEVVMSLWSVNDESTEYLMTNFHC